MLLIAQRQLHGVYGLVCPGGQFQAPDDVAKVLVKRGLAAPFVCGPSENKSLTPSENKFEASVTGDAPVALADMTKAQIIEHAKTLGLALGVNRNKADLINAVESHQSN